MGTGTPARRLPAELTGFIGRRAELAQVRAALEGARLVTLTGPGAVSYTHLTLPTTPYV